MILSGLPVYNKRNLVWMYAFFPFTYIYAH
jgi:hypothetical protein